MTDPGILKLLDFLQAVETAKTCVKPEDIIPLIKKYGLVREHIPTPLLKNADVWRALLQKMPMTAMIRNLGKMTAIELLAPLNGDFTRHNHATYAIITIQLENLFLTHSTLQKL